MNSLTTNQFDVIKFLKSKSTLLVLFYIYISIIGFLYTLIYNSGITIELFRYYELTDFLLIGIINYKVLFFSLSVMIIVYTLITETEIYFIRRFREVGYGERFDSESEKALLVATVKSIIKSLLYRMPLFALLSISIIKYWSDSQGTYILFFLLGLFYFLILIFIKIIRSRSGSAGDFNTIALSIVIFLGFFVGIVLGYSDRKKPQKYDYVRIETDGSTIEGELIGSSKNYFFFRDTTIQVINKNSIQSIEFIPFDSIHNQFNKRIITPKLDSITFDTLNQSESKKNISDDDILLDSI